MAAAATFPSQLPVGPMLDAALNRFDRFSDLLEKAADRAGYFENSILQANGKLIDFGRSLDDTRGKFDTFVGPFAMLADKATSAGNAIEKLCQRLSTCCASPPAPGAKGGPAGGGGNDSASNAGSEDETLLGNQGPVRHGVQGTVAAGNTALGALWVAKKLLERGKERRALRLFFGRFGTAMGLLNAVSDAWSVKEDIDDGHYWAAAADTTNVVADLAVARLMRNSNLPPGQTIRNIFAWGRGAGARASSMGSRIIGIGGRALGLSSGAAEGVEIAAVGGGVAAGEGGLLAALGLSGPVGWTILGLIAAGTVGTWAYNHWDSIKEWAGKPHPFVEGLANAIIPGSGGVIHGVNSLIHDPKPLQDMIKPVADQASALWKESAPWRQTAYDMLPPGFLKAGIGLGSYAIDHPKETIDAVSSTVDTVSGAVSSSLDWAWDNIVPAIPFLGQAKQMYDMSTAAANMMAQQQMQGPMMLGPGMMGGGPQALNGPVLATGPVLLANPEELKPKGPQPKPKPVPSSTDIRVLIKNLPPGSKVSSSTRGDGVRPQVGYTFGH